MTDNACILSPAKEAAIKIATDWLSYASKTTGFPEEKVRKLLKDRFEKFEISKTGEMMTYLRSIMDKEFCEEKLEAAITPPIPTCPICGESVIPDPRWDSKFTKKPGWRCKAGGLDHFLKAKANSIRRLQGEPIMFKEVVSESDTNAELETNPETV